MKWFYDLVQLKLGDILDRHRFKQLTGKAYEVDENEERHGIIMYASDAQIKMSVDILTRHTPDSEFTPFYLVRIGVGKVDLKEWLYPNIRSETDDVNLWMGWKCLNQGDVEKAFDEIAVGLESYLDQLQNPSHTD